MTGFVEIHKEMGTNHKDFLRYLPKSVPDADIHCEGDEKTGAKIIIENAPLGRMEIDLSAVGERRIALICLPVTHVTFRFFDVSEEAAHAEHARMAKSFQRGGG